jgi:hypothetical protein
MNKLHIKHGQSAMISSPATDRAKDQHITNGFPILVLGFCCWTCNNLLIKGSNFFHVI